MSRFFKLINIIYVTLALIITLILLANTLFHFSIELGWLRGFGFAFIAYPVSLSLIIFAFAASDLSPVFKIGIPALLLIILVAFVIAALYKLIKRNKVGMLFFIYILDIIISFISMINAPSLSLIVITAVRVMIIAPYFILKRKYQG